MLAIHAAQSRDASHSISIEPWFAGYVADKQTALCVQSRSFPGKIIELKIMWQIGSLTSRLESIMRSYLIICIFFSRPNIIAGESCSTVSSCISIELWFAGYLADCIARAVKIFFWQDHPAQDLRVSTQWRRIV